MFKIKEDFYKFPIPLKFFNKFNSLTLSQRAYLKAYRDNVKNPQILTVISNLLSKPIRKDFILEHDYSVNYEYLSAKSTTIKGIIPSNSVIISNHPSYLDAFIIHYYCLFKFHFKPLVIAGKWAMSRIWIRLITKLLKGKVILNNLAGIRKALNYLKNNGSVVLFPEGTLSKKANKIYDGFYWLAKQSKTDIYPIIIRRKGLFYKLEFKNRIHWWDDKAIEIFKNYLKEAK